MKIEDIIDLRKSIIKLYEAALDDSKNGANPFFQNAVTEIFDDIIIREYKERHGMSSSNSVATFPPTYRQNNYDQMGAKNPLNDGR